MKKKMGNSIHNNYEMESDKLAFGDKHVHHGFFKGVVVDNRDPKTLGRCKVRVYQLHGDEQAIADEELPFAAYMAPEAGTDSGAFTPPDIGGRVWVFFEQGDINHPVYAGGWFTENSGSPDAVESKQADKVKDKGDKSKDDATKTKEAAEQTQSAANNLGGAIDKASQAVERTGEAADALDSSITELIESTPSDATGGADIPATAKQKFNNAAAKNVLAAKDVGKAAEKATNSQTEISNSVANAAATAAGVNESNLEISTSLATIMNSSQVTGTSLVEANNVKAANSIVTASDSVRESAQTNVATGELMVPTATAHGNTVAELNTQQSQLTATVAAITSLLNSNWTYSSFISSLTGHKATTSAVSSKVKNELKPKVDNSKKESEDLIKQAADLVKKATLSKNDAKKAGSSVKKKIAKTANKKYEDPPTWAKRPHDYNDEPTQVEPGHEGPVESQAIAANVPSMKVLKKTGKGHAIYFNDMDSKESLAIVDRAGNSLYMDCPVPKTGNAGNQLQRGSKSAQTGDALEQRDMRDGGSKIGLKDQAQSKIELDSREGAEKIIIIANDGQQGGVENGKNRQVITVSSGGNSITIESIKGGDVKSKIVVDANSGAVQIEAATCVQINAKFISIKADHINLDGRVNINGDATVAGRFTGGNV